MTALLKNGFGIAAADESVCIPVKRLYYARILECLK